MGSKAGVIKIAAQRIGLSLEEYMTHIDAGEKWCHKGRHWAKITTFGIDKSRGDGHDAICQNCRYQSTGDKPGQRERRQKRLLGLAYCRGCKDWLPMTEVHQGQCRFHINEEDRRRYDEDPTYKRERKQHAHSRQRGVKPIPPIGQASILEEFNGKCAYCQSKATTWDHVYPIAINGITTPSNIVPACASCNSSKQDKDVIEWLKATNRTPSSALMDRLILSECSPHCVYEFPER